MSKITAADVKKLRDMTGAGMMDCKKALKEADGDIEKAIEYLRKKGQKLSLKRADREAKEGVVVAVVSDDNNKGVIIRLSCETDFVAKNEDFINLAKGIANHALSTFAEDLDSLLASDYEGIKLADKITEQVGVIGEKVEIAQYEKLEAPMIVPYIHMGYRAGVIVGLNKDTDDAQEAGKNVAMQVAAMKPVSLSEEEVPQDIINKELEIGKELARQEGKPEAILEKIAQGRLKKFFKENTLLHQTYVKDSKTDIKGYLSSVEKDLTVEGFRHVTLG